MTKQDKLLNEQTIRRWAKLADVSVISETFFTEEEEVTEETVTENSKTDETDEDETETETVTELEAATGENAIEEEAHEEGEEEGDMEVEMEEDGASDADGMDVVQAILKALEPFGVETEEDDEGEESPMPEMEAGDEGDAAMAHEDPAMADPAMDHGMGDHYNRKDDTVVEVVDEEALTEAVLKRVLERILNKK